MKRFIIEGAIGVGKSTVLKALEQQGYAVFYEPTEKWKKWLDEFYGGDGSADAAILLQQKIMETMIERALLINQSNHEVVIIERSFLSGLYVFLHANKELKPHPHWTQVEQDYLKCVDKYENQCDADLIRIALDCPFETVLSRSRERGNSDASGSVHYHKRIYLLCKKFEKQCAFTVSTCDSVSIEQCITNVCNIIKQNM